MKKLDMLVGTALVGAVLAGSLSLAPLALAQDPDVELCVAARADLDLALAAVLELSPEVLDGATTVKDLTATALEALLVDDEAGEGAQVVIRAALAARAAVDLACAEPVPPTSTAPAPSSTPGLPAPDVDDGLLLPAPDPVVVDADLAVTG